MIILLCDWSELLECFVLCAGDTKFVPYKEKKGKIKRKKRRSDDGVGNSIQQSNAVPPCQWRKYAELTVLLMGLPQIEFVLNCSVSHEVNSVGPFKCTCTNM